jgi:predicted transcriptional regulator YdeE
MEQVEGFSFIGIQTRTTNENNLSGLVMSELWRKFHADDVFLSIPNKSDDRIFVIYTDYEKDHTKSYTALIGAKVSGIHHIPLNMVGRQFPEANFERFVAAGKLPESVIRTWQKIWEENETLKRKYLYDFEVYSPIVQAGVSPEVDIFVSVA